MLDIILSKSKFTSEQKKRVKIFYNAISHAYHTQRPRKGATRDDILSYFKSHHIRYSPEEVSRFLQFMKDNQLIINRETNYWITLY